jgi:pimeloyl-ACP methyl ester carboxylesterase
MKAPDTAAFTIALGDSDEKHAWPHGANVRSPAQLFLTVHGNQADLLRASDGHALSPTPTVTVDPDRRQIEVRLSHEAWNPGRRTVRIAMGAGLWDKQAGNYLQPGPTASATTPGGASPSHEALFNMAFRTDEPVPKINTPGIANTIVEGHVLVQQDATYWRERQQADVLASGDVTPFAADVSFKKLMKKVRDDSAVPRSGDIDRIFASRFVFGQGADFNAKCLTSTAGECSGRYVGQLQPYALYVPKKRLPREGFGLVISMHGLSANYNEFLGSNEARQMADRGTGSIFASPEGRGPDGGYKSYAEADVFEMWADIARSYKLNPALTDVTGYSMGGGGTYRLAGRWPDLFARAFPIVGPPTSAASFKSLRNIPVMAWYGHTDELVGPEMSEEAFLNAEQSGIRYDHWEFVPAGHITEGNNDEYGPAADFFGNHTVDPNPPHVTYLYDPSQDPKALSPSNHAYWISAITLADPSNSGAVDARSHGFGVGDAPVLPVKFSAGTLDGGSHGSIPYERRTIDWGSTPSEPKADTLDVVVSNVASLVIDPQRAQVDCKAKVNLTSDVQTKVILANC